MNYQELQLNELLANADLVKQASKESLRLLTQSYPKVPNTDKGFGIATARFEELMDHDNGTDDGELVHQALQHKRWALQEHFSNLYGWDIC